MTLPANSVQPEDVREYGKSSVVPESQSVHHLSSSASVSGGVTTSTGQNMCCTVPSQQDVTVGDSGRQHKVVLQTCSSAHNLASKKTLERVSSVPNAADGIFNIKYQDKSKGVPARQQHKHLTSDVRPIASAPSGPECTGETLSIVDSGNSTLPPISTKESIDLGSIEKSFPSQTRHKVENIELEHLNRKKDERIFSIPSEKISRRSLTDLGIIETIQKPSNLSTSNVSPALNSECSVLSSGKRKTINHCHQRSSSFIANKEACSFHDNPCRVDSDANSIGCSSCDENTRFCQATNVSQLSACCNSASDSKENKASISGKMQSSYLSKYNANAEVKSYGSPFKIVLNIRPDVIHSTSPHKLKNSVRNFTCKQADTPQESLQMRMLERKRSKIAPNETLIKSEGTALDASASNLRNAEMNNSPEISDPNLNFLPLVINDSNLIEMNSKYKNKSFTRQKPTSFLTEILNQSTLHTSSPNSDFFKFWSDVKTSNNETFGSTTALAGSNSSHNNSNCNVSQETSDNSDSEDINIRSRLVSKNNTSVSIPDQSSNKSLLDYWNKTYNSVVTKTSRVSDLSLKKVSTMPENQDATYRYASPTRRILAVTDDSSKCTTAPIDEEEAWFDSVAKLNEEWFNPGIQPSLASQDHNVSCLRTNDNLGIRLSGATSKDASQSSVYNFNERVNFTVKSLSPYCPAISVTECTVNRVSGSDRRKISESIDLLNQAVNASECDVTSVLRNNVHRKPDVMQNILSKPLSNSRIKCPISPTPKSPRSFYTSATNTCTGQAEFGSSTTVYNKRGVSSITTSNLSSAKTTNIMALRKVLQQRGLRRRLHTNKTQTCLSETNIDDAGTVREIEAGLLHLMEEFQAGNLAPFGKDSRLRQMEEIREQQESLAKLHQEVGARQDLFQPLSDEGLRNYNEHMDTLMGKLECLSEAIEKLHSNTATASRVPTDAVTSEGGEETQSKPPVSNRSTEDDVLKKHENLNSHKTLHGKETIVRETTNSLNESLSEKTAVLRSESCKHADSQKFYPVKTYSNVAYGSSSADTKESNTKINKEHILESTNTFNVQPNPAKVVSSGILTSLEKNTTVKVNVKPEEYTFKNVQGIFDHKHSPELNASSSSKIPNKNLQEVRTVRISSPSRPQEGFSRISTLPPVSSAQSPVC